MVDAKVTVHHDDILQTPYFNYKSSQDNLVHQVWFDDPTRYVMGTPKSRKSGTSTESLETENKADFERVRQKKRWNHGLPIVGSDFLVIEQRERGKVGGGSGY